MSMTSIDNVLFKHDLPAPYVKLVDPFLQKARAVTAGLVDALEEGIAQHDNEIITAVTSRLLSWPEPAFLSAFEVNRKLALKRPGFSGGRFV